MSTRTCCQSVAHTSPTLLPSQGSKYNIPILVWVLEHYPLQAPLVYVVPTNDMIIKPNHPFVDGSGQVCACRGRAGGGTFPFIYLCDL